jgi:hypothetical protein
MLRNRGFPFNSVSLSPSCLPVACNIDPNVKLTSASKRLFFGRLEPQCGEANVMTACEFVHQPTKLRVPMVWR